VEEVRKDKAMRYVASDHYALGEIAFLLGFSELSAFSRAFKRWTGIAPAQYRARHLIGEVVGEVSSDTKDGVES
jgi:AraC-like DNA-binding protein